LKWQAPKNKAAGDLAIVVDVDRRERAFHLDLATF